MTTKRDPMTDPIEGDRWTSPRGAVIRVLRVTGSKHLHATEARYSRLVLFTRPSRKSRATLEDALRLKDEWPAELARWTCDPAPTPLAEPVSVGAKACVLVALKRAGEPRTASQLERATGFTARRLRDVLDELADEGVVRLDRAEPPRRWAP